MKNLLAIVLLVLVAGCDSGSISVEDDVVETKSIRISATGLIDSVSLLESVSNIIHVVPTNGNYLLKLSEGQSIYQVDIVDSKQQSCTLSDDLDLNCELTLCTADYNPVCAKQPFAGVVCVTTPCDTDKYVTFSNTCHARVVNAWIALESECQGLEEVISEHIKPVYVTDLAVIVLNPDTFTILSSSIVADTLTLDFQVSGGCGSHEFDLLVNEYFAESDPVQLSNMLNYQNNDSCDGLINVQKVFDLEPIKEIYRRAYPDSFGEQIVILSGIGNYTFDL